MDREEAIDLLDNLIGFIEDNHSSDYDKALKMAIEALKQEPSNVMEHDKDHIWYKGKQYISLSRFLQVKEPCEDAISRQAVLDGIEELKKSPWATDKRGFGFEYLIKEALEVVADLCVKQAPSVNPQVPKYCDRNICIKNEYNGIGCDECEVTKSQEPKTGHRLYNDIYDHYLCENCKTIVMDYDNYCPNCGAKMVEPQERSDKV